MAAAYQYTANSGIIRRVADNAYIPMVNGNSDYAVFGAWVEAGNVPDPYVPPALTPSQQFAAALAQGIELVWSESNYLTATYAIDQVTQLNITAEMVSVLSNGVFGTGQATRPWADIQGQMHEFNVAQFKQFASTIQLYINELNATMIALSTGQSATWPSNVFNITG